MTRGTCGEWRRPSDIGVSTSIGLGVLGPALTSAVFGTAGVLTVPLWMALGYLIGRRLDRR